MRRTTPITQQLYAYLFPHPTSNDPPSFSAHLARNLVPEVRIEVATFYGDLNSAEARYPGLNYCYAPHRMRLGRFKHHKRLFDAFDGLGLTYNEIQEFCCWEGTKWARERYEKDENVKVVDTTGDEIPYFVDKREQMEVEEARRRSITRQTDISVIVEEAGTHMGSQQTAESSDEPMSDDADAEIEARDASTRAEERLQEVAALREHVTEMSELSRRREQAINRRIIAAWEQGQSLPPEIEQFLKEQSERGTLGVGMDLRSIINRREFRVVPTANAAQTSAVAPRHNLPTVTM